MHMLAVCVGDMGEDPMAAAASRLVDYFQPTLCVNLGVTGSLHDTDMKVGDVMVGWSVRKPR